MTTVDPLYPGHEDMRPNPILVLKKENWMADSTAAKDRARVTGSGQPLIDALSELGGLTLHIRHALKPANQRLMDTLGVTVLIDPDAPECERFHDRTGERQRCRQCAMIARRNGDT